MRGVLEAINASTKWTVSCAAFVTVAYYRNAAACQPRRLHPQPFFSRALKFAIKRAAGRRAKG